jgi:hypothetical protein
VLSGEPGSPLKEALEKARVLFYKVKKQQKKVLFWNFFF